jgi:dinuclear metal center YbgI/SA1388 family protein
MSASITIKQVTDYLEAWAPKAYQESYDNAGLICGDPTWTVRGILVSLDCIESVIQEAIETNCNLVVAHHPIIFRGLKKLTGSNYVERTIIKAIKSDIAIYAIHTNLDNVYTGVNQRIAEKIGLRNLRILDPKPDTLSKLVTFVPHEHTEKVLSAMYAAGAGPNESARPFIGEANQTEYVEENRIEVILPTSLESRVLAALRKSHPYEEVPYYLTALRNGNQEVGAGMLGELDSPMEPLEFLTGLKTRMNLESIRHTSLINRKIKRVAVCGGAGSFLIHKAIAAGADAFVSADFKYHEFFDADGRLVIADIGHYESEVFTKDLLKEVLMKNFPTFAINFSNTVTNPISHL